MKYLTGLLFLLLIANIYAVCDDRQIDINSASLEKLDEIKWVGPATAEKIIAARPFGSVDDLVKVSGIAEGKLADIKEQGLACVANKKISLEEKIEENSETESSDEEESEVEENSENIQEFLQEINDEKTSEVVEEEIKTINLNSETKDIKSENNKEYSGINYAKYGFIGFCILLALLFIFKNKKTQELD